MRKKENMVKNNIFIGNESPPTRKLWKTNENYNLLCPNKLKHIKKMTQDMKQHKL